MRSVVHDIPVRFRVNARLLAAARSKGEREGLTMSELMRSALRREVSNVSEYAGPDGGSPATRNSAPVIDLVRFDANAGVGLAASQVLLGSALGSLEAQRCLRQEWSATLYSPEGQGPDSDLTDAGGLLMARLCAANGDHTDATMLAMLLVNVGIRLRNRGRFAAGWECIAESLSLYERLGAAGDLEAVEMAKELMPTLPFEVVEMAKQYTLKGKTDGTPAAPACTRAVH